MGLESFLKTQEVFKIPTVNEFRLRSSPNFRLADDRYQQEKNWIFANHRDETKTVIIERLGLKEPVANWPTKEQTHSTGKIEKITGRILC